MPAARRALCFGPSIPDYSYISTLLLTTDRVCGTGFTSWLRGAFSRNDPEKRSQEWRPTLRRDPQRGRSGPRPPGVNAWRGQSLRLRFHCREPASWVRIRKPPRWSAERGPGRPGTGWSRVAGATERMSAACRRSITPHRGTELLLSRRPPVPNSPADAQAKAHAKRRTNPGAATRRGNEQHCAV